jgi:hypothetical protein
MVPATRYATLDLDDQLLYQFQPCCNNGADISKHSLGGSLPKLRGLASHFETVRRSGERAESDVRDAGELMAH